MARSVILALLFMFASVTGCAAPHESPPTFTQLGDDTLIVTGETEALNYAISHAVFSLGDPDADPESGIRRVPSYHDRSEFRSIERDGEKVVYEQRTIRFDTPEGVTVETLAVYTPGQTTVRIETTPQSDAVRTKFANAIASALRERGVPQHHPAQRTGLAN